MTETNNKTVESAEQDQTARMYSLILHSTLFQLKMHARTGRVRVKVHYTNKRRIIVAKESMSLGKYIISLHHDFCLGCLHQTRFNF